MKNINSSIMSSGWFESTWSPFCFEHEALLSRRVLIKLNAIWENREMAFREPGSVMVDYIWRSRRMRL